MDQRTEDDLPKDAPPCYALWEFWALVALAFAVWVAYFAYPHFA